MIDIIVTCLLIGLGFAIIVISLVKSVLGRNDINVAKREELDDITNPSRSWHPLNMWNDD